MLDSKPKKRADCVDLYRPCPWVSCRYHLAHELAQDPRNNFQAEDLDEMQQTCALDVADDGPTDVITVAKLLKTTVMIVKTTQRTALAKLKAGGRV